MAIAGSSRRSASSAGPAIPGRFAPCFQSGARRASIRGPETAWILANTSGVRSAGTFGGAPEPVKYPARFLRSMKCPSCGRDSGLNPFSICQFCGNAMQQPEELDADGADVRPENARAGGRRARSPNGRAPPLRERPARVMPIRRRRLPLLARRSTSRCPRSSPRTSPRSLWRPSRPSGKS